MSATVVKKDFEAYLREARSWETDKLQQLERSRTIAWRVAVGSAVLATAAVLALAALTPLKRVEPFVIRVDNSTGIVDVVQTLKDGNTTYDEAMNKYFTQWYVRYREGYSKELAPDYYTNVGLMSVGLEQQKYFEFFNPKNPLSPLNVFGPYAKVKVRIREVEMAETGQVSREDLAEMEQYLGPSVLAKLQSLDDVEACIEHARACFGS